MPIYKDLDVYKRQGQLKDKSFNQGTFDGVKLYAANNGLSYKYYQPANGDQATDDDRYDAMKAACLLYTSSRRHGGGCRVPPSASHSRAEWREFPRPRSAAARYRPR